MPHASQPARQLPPRKILVDGRRVTEPEEKTKRRNEKMNERMPWPEERESRGRSPIADFGEQG